jgi:hypothetical protein
MTTERKIIISAGFVCIAFMAASLVGVAICFAVEAPGWGLVCFAVGVVAFWIGSAIADVLRANPEK